MAKKIYEGLSFDDLCKKYLKEGAEISDLAVDAPVEGGVDEFDAEMDAPADDFAGEEGLEGEGDVTITLSADLVSALRSIMALVDGEGVEEAPVDEFGAEDGLGAEDDIAPADDAGLEVEPEGEVGEFEEEDCDEEEGVYEEDEETLLGNGQGAQAAPVSSPSSAPNRKKETPAVDRKPTNTAHKAKPGKKVLDINR